MGQWKPPLALPSDRVKSLSTQLPAQTHFVLNTSWRVGKKPGKEQFSRIPGLRLRTLWHRRKVCARESDILTPHVMQKAQPIKFHELYLLLILPLACVLACPARAQQVPPADPPSASTNADFVATADEVLHDMSEITGWKLKSPLKKTIRTREEIRAYVICQMDDDKDAKERYASARSAEAFGLIPKGFDFDAFLVDLLTEQIAGLYDPKQHEFYIADWISPEDQRMVMSHELTHALQDQSFQIESWVKAARPNDDAELAREAVLEGSAMAGMLQYTLKDKGLNLLDLPEFDPSVFVGDMSETPLLKKAPPFIKDSLMFPYFSGLTFSISVLRASGWSGFNAVFLRPPVDTQQVMHPDIYRAAKAPAAIKSELPDGVPGGAWTKLEENSMGEFGWKEALKQFLGDERAKTTAASWDGDSYATFEQKDSKRLLLAARIQLSSVNAAAHFFGQYSELLEKKYPEHSHLFRRPDFSSFVTPEKNVFLRCFEAQCIIMEGGERPQFLQWNKSLGWEAIPEEPRKPGSLDVTSTQLFAR